MGGSGRLGGYEQVRKEPEQEEKYGKRTAVRFTIYSK